MVKAAQAARLAKEEDKSFMDLVREYFRYYCERSTIHCVRYLYDPRLHNVERLIWSVLLIVSVTLCCSFYLLLSERFGAQKLQTVIENPQYPVFYVHFPAVGVCTDNRINWSKVDAAKAQFLPANSSEELVEGFTKLIAYLETLRFDNFKYSVSELEDQNLEALDFINLSSLVHFLTLGCEDILVSGSCMWRQTVFNCCDYFVLEKTEYGLCLVFNSELSDQSHEIRKREGDAYYPKHNAKAGQNSGLNFNLLLNDSFKRPNSLATDNVYLMVKKPNQINNDAHSITPNTETHVTVQPLQTRTDNTTRDIPPARRNCHFVDESVDFGISDAPGRLTKSFLLFNCLTNCHESYLVKLCNCTLPIFFPKTRQDIFRYNKHLEEDDYYSVTKQGMTCPCMVSCNLLEYYTSTTTLPLSAKNLPASPTLKFFKVDVHYAVEMMITYRTSLEFSSIDLIANLGGIFGLCLGASMVSGVELIYFLTVGFLLHLYDNKYNVVFCKNLKRMWVKCLRYLQNEVSHVHHESGIVKATPKSKLRHPFNKRTNAW
ncbi:GH18687 [Drosophila grimshawi]|uniref:GH18687 n=1 Tax=Drosophila grimshawi TaxID=7222 RepID=B4JGU5_DROGR|nr:GH18687 [Drosophila grimshawi]